MMTEPIALSGSDFNELAALVAEYGGVAALRTVLESQPRTKRARQVVAFRDAGQVLDALAQKVVTKEEARRLLGLPKKAKKTTGGLRS